MYKNIQKNQQFIRQKPIIAMIGGAGPDAAIDLQIKLFNTMKEKLNIFSDQDHYRIIVDNNIDLPNRDMALLNGCKSPLQMYIQSAVALENMGANILLIACNSAHNYFEQIQKSTSMVMINMIEETAEYIAQHYSGIKQIGLLSTVATIKGRLYHQALGKYGIDVIEPSGEYQQKIVQAIYGIKAGFTSQNFLANKNHEEKLLTVYKNAVDVAIKSTSLAITDNRLPEYLLHDAFVHFIGKGVKLIILGCTELPLISNNIYVSSEINIIDPTLILAQNTIQKCMEWEYSNFLNERRAICVG